MKRLIRKASSMLLYHGTYYEVAEQIIKDGAIRPSNDTNVTNTETYTMQPDCVYLANDEREANGYGGEGYKDNGDTIIFEVSLDTTDNNFVTDEDALLLDEDQFIMDLDDIFTKNGLDTTPIYEEFDINAPDKFFNKPEYRPMLEELLNKMDPFEGLEIRDTIAYRGSIPLNAIVSIINGSTGDKTNNVSLVGLAEIGNKEFA